MREMIVKVTIATEDISLRMRVGTSSEQAAARRGLNFYFFRSGAIGGHVE